MAGVTGLEPAAFCVTGRRYNQLNYTPVARSENIGMKAHLVKVKDEERATPKPTARKARLRWSALLRARAVHSSETSIL